MPLMTDCLFWLLGKNCDFLQQGFLGLHNMYLCILLGQSQLDVYVLLIIYYDCIMVWIVL